LLLLDRAAMREEGALEDGGDNPDRSAYGEMGRSCHDPHAADTALP
jgi:hypothetical protein